MIRKWLKRFSAMPISAPKWPRLPTAGYIRGRAANVDDVDRGDAVFSQQTDGDVSAEPYPIVIPQYALWKDAEMTVPVVLVQAEQHIIAPDDEPIFGLRNLQGEAIVASGNEVQLLGTDLPR